MLYSLRALTVATSFRICYKLKPITPYLKRQCALLLHTSSPSGGTSTRFQNPRRRKGNKPGKALLDKFVKHLSHDGGLYVGKLMIECRGRTSYSGILNKRADSNTYSLMYLDSLYFNFPMSVSLCVSIRTPPFQI